VVKKKADKALLAEGHRGYVVAIDGPSGAGKSTVSRQLAEALGGRLLDTGGMYRGVAFHAIEQEITDDEAALGKIARGLRFSADKTGETLLINGEDLGHKLRTQQVSQMASFVSKFPKVRKVLTQKQRSLAKLWSRRWPVVVEGRDIGTVVFPDVEFKFYVTAAPEVRAQRRYAQLKKQGVRGVRLKAILRQNEERDLQDSTREVAPLRCPEDAVVVDTSSMGISQVVKFMRDHIRGRLLLPNVEHH
jgi:cytidylate kinase